MRDLQAGVAVALVAVPQGIAYALIAGLPPAMGLYSAAIPTVIGSLFRSSRHVITGPTNALALLVGSLVAARTGNEDPVVVATTLTLVTGLIQLTASGLRLGVIADFISAPVALGYVTGAAALIAAGQLHNATTSPGEPGSLLHQLFTWIEGIGQVHPPSITIAMVTATFVVVMRRWDARIPGPFAAMSLGIAATAVLGLAERGVPTLATVASVPEGWPPFTVPDWSVVPGLGLAGVAAAVLTLIESSAAGRALATRCGQYLDSDAELRGQGLANAVGSWFGSFVTSASLTRSELNFRLGARSRTSGVISGLAMLGVPLMFAPLVNLTPIPVLAGVLIVVAVDLVDAARIRVALRTSSADALAFVATLIGTLSLRLDLAVLLGVGVSVALFLRQARLLRMTEFVVDGCGRLREVELEVPAAERIRSVRILNLEGPLFFGAAGELRRGLHALIEGGAKAVVLRVRRTQGCDATIAGVLEETACQLRNLGGALLVAGTRSDILDRLSRSGAEAAIGAHNFLPPRQDAFLALADAIRLAAEPLALQNDAGGIALLRRLSGR